MRGLRRKMMMMSILDLNVDHIIAKTGMGFISDWIPGKDTKLVVTAMFTDSVQPKRNSYLVASHGSDEEFSILIGGDYDQRMQFQIYNNKPFPIEGPFIFKLEENTIYEFELNSSFIRYNTNIQYRNRMVVGTVPLGIGCRGESSYKSATFHIYSIKCWNNGILERDFVPAKKDGIYGLYDKVNKKFWRSSSGVDFLGKDK